MGLFYMLCNRKRFALLDMGNAFLLIGAVELLWAPAVLLAGNINSALNVY